ncbi:MAG: RnfABCDGE type electron transport complex subunit A [Lachnospiraceae bacterium]|nr:RnfABCDGE type electron transport complex subunit A [Lachnospiraceae bacterium]
MFVQLLLVVISTALVNNVVLSQFLGLCPFLGVSKKTDMAIGMGVAVIFVIAIASTVTSLIQNLILVPQGIEYLQTIVFILVIAGLVQFVEMFMKKNMPALYESLGVFLPLITTNCAVLGVAINNSNDFIVGKGYNIFTSLLFSIVQGVGTAVGFTIAIVLLASIREKIEHNDIPAAFKGSPIVLFTAGLMAIAMFGFSGLV